MQYLIFLDAKKLQAKGLLMKIRFLATAVTITLIWVLVNAHYKWKGKKKVFKYSFLHDAYTVNPSLKAMQIL